MKILLPSEFRDLIRFVPEFIALCGAPFQSRIRQLHQDFDTSPFLAKIVIDYHWMELCLANLSDTDEAHDGKNIDNWCAVKFAFMCVEAHRQLTPRGRTELEGRLRDALKSDAGFAPLYAEMDTASRFLAMGFDVGFEDMDGRAKFDFLVSDDEEACEIECKSFSVDAGRKIHRRDFYRLVNTVEQELAALPPNQKEALVVTLKGRLSGSEPQRKEIAQAIRSHINEPSASARSTEECRIEVVDLSNFDLDDDLHAKIKERFGENAHAAGAFTDTSSRMLIVRSEAEDDTSKPVLQHIRFAAEQLSKSRPGFVALQFNDTELSDTLPDNLVRRVGILSNAAFYHYQATHLAGVFASSYRNALGDGTDLASVRGLIILNPAKAAELGPSFRFLTDGAQDYEV
ncbi:MAG: hypothetical protein GYB49_05770 [Alphaproteobacteria bacterium]|nr:hypothetical protein [Hyphomonas sp.]MBR9806713.1 hypothetical protein [Alphaproteobacteria bacterium]|tara:strand:- start:1380 stop:2582 length:1203 start_codon:yes stop_codon:yes gene_type:complete